MSNSIKQSKQLKLSTMGKVAVFMTLSGLSVSAMANIKPADNQSQVHRENNVEILDIKAPNNKGLSHNKFNQFDVEKQGAVINNISQGMSRSQVANKWIGTNDRLKANRESASVILNEVVSKNPSLLLGTQEVVGKPADYVLANPNGITCNDCGFINTPKASLVVGKSDVQNGQIAGFDVTSNNKLTARGNLSAEDTLNLIAPTVDIDGNVTAENSINLLMGHNKIGADGTATAVDVSNGSRVAPPVLDGKIFGSMQSGSIRIHSTDKNATVGIKGKLTAEETHTSDQENVRGIVTKTSLDKRVESYEKSSIDADNVNVNVAGKLAIEGTDLTTKNASLTAGSVDLAAGKSTKTLTSTRNSGKSRWADERKTEHFEQKVHTTGITADNLDIVATDGDVTGQAVQVDAKNARIVAKDSVNLSGDADKYNSSSIHQFKNEGYRLRTGSTLDNVNNNDYVATDIDADKLVIASEGTINLAGVQADVDSVALTADKVNLSAEKSGKSHKKVYQEAYWGGTFGSDANRDIKDQEIQNGTNINVADTALLNGKNGVNVSGSSVKSKGESFVKSDGNINVNSVAQTTEIAKGHRKGSLFDITQEEEQNWSETKTNQASHLRSDADLTVVTDKNLNVVGSKLEASGLLDVNAKDVNVSASHNTSTGGSHQVGNTGIDYGITKLELLDNEINVENVLKQKIKFAPKIGANIGVQFFDKTTETESTSADGSSLTGGTTKVTADKVKLTGSNITATEGDVTVDADQIATQASHKTTTTGVNNTTVDLDLDVELSQTGVTDGVSIEVNNKQGITVEQDAVTSSITAENGKVDLTADSISHEGTNITAETVNQKADNISQTSATSSTVSDIDDTKVNLGVTVSGQFTGAIDGKVNIAGEGGNTKKKETQAVVSQVNGDNINITAKDKLTDEGTNYQGNDIDLTAGDYENTSATNTKHETSHTAGAGVNVGVGTADPESVKVDVGVSGKYQYEDSNSTEAVNSNINADNSLAITADNINTQANMKGQKIDLNADVVNQSQAENTANSTSGGFDAKLDVGAVVAVASGGMPIPTIDVGVSANGGKSDKVEGVATTIEAGDLNINAKKDLSLQGTSIDATNANLTSEQVTISGTTSSSKVVGGSAGAKVNLSDDFKNVGLGANFDVKHEVASGGEQANVNADNVNINSTGDVNLTGVVVNAENANVATDGDLNIGAINNKLQKNNVGAGIDLSASNGKDGFNVGGGSGNLSLDLANNSTHTDAGINASSASVNADNVSLVGANVNADNLTGKVEGTLTTENVVNKVNENTLELGVNGKAGKVNTDQVVTDGKLGGVDAGLSMDFHHNSKVTNQTAGVASANNSLEVGATNLDDSQVAEQDLNFGFDFDVSTDVEGMKQQAINDIKKGKTPIVHVDGVTIVPEGVDINPSFDVNQALTDLVQKK